MSNLINLNKARKDKLRNARRHDTNVHSVKFGRSKADKQAMAAKLSKAARTLDGHKVDDPDA